jgi:hypothetical protein
VPLRSGAPAKLLAGGDHNGKRDVVKEITEFAVGDILECAVSFKDVAANENDEINFFFSVRTGEEEVERCPWRGYITVTVPTPDFEAMMWH